MERRDLPTGYTCLTRSWPLIPVKAGRTRGSSPVQEAWLKAFNDREQGAPRRPRKRAPREQKAPEQAPGLAGQSAPQSGEEFWRAFVRRAITRLLQAALAQAQAAALGRSRDERQPTPHGYRHGSADGTVKTAAGIFRPPAPPRPWAPRTLACARVGRARTDE
jgi:hypothetical protein